MHLTKYIRKLNKMLVGAGKKKTTTSQPKESNEPPVLQEETSEQYLQQVIELRDYSSAATFIEFIRDELRQPYTKELALWHGYSLFHLGEYTKAIQVYEKLLEQDPEDTSLHLYISSCHFYNQDYDAAQISAEKGPMCDLRTRLLFHIANKRNDETQLFKAHSDLIGTLENQLSFAAIHYQRTNYEDAIEIYDRLLQQHPEFLALYVYVAMCQFKLDKFENSNESVDQYLGVNSDSAVALNLKACAYFQLFGADIAESQLLQIRKFASASYSFIDSIIKHNVVIFHNGEDGFTVLPQLVDVLPEARFNLALLYMRQNNSAEAYNLLQSFQPSDINDNILKAVIMLAYGQLTSDPALVDEASAIFNEIGSMEVVKDTVPGRQCFASTKFVTGDFTDCLRIFDTIEEFDKTDEFNYNKAMALANLERWAEAERYFLKVQNEYYTKEIFYTSWLCRCYIKNRKPELAYKLYEEAQQAEDAKTLLQIIANDCYHATFYYYSMKAYDLLSKVEDDPTIREGMIASAIGVFRGVLSRKEQPDKVIEVLTCLASEPEAEQVLNIIKNYIETSGEFTYQG